MPNLSMSIRMVLGHENYLYTVEDDVNKLCNSSGDGFQIAGLNKRRYRFLRDCSRKIGNFGGGSID